MYFLAKNVVYVFVRSGKEKKKIGKVWTRTMKNKRKKIQLLNA
jgi:hypothetical protein